MLDSLLIKGQGGMIYFPTGATYHPSNPFWGTRQMQGLRGMFFLIVVGGEVPELNLIPRYESVIALDSDAGICPNLCFQYPRSRARPLCE